MIHPKNVNIRNIDGCLVIKSAKLPVGPTGWEDGITVKDCIIEITGNVLTLRGMRIKYINVKDGTTFTESAVTEFAAELGISVTALKFKLKYEDPNKSPWIFRMLGKLFKQVMNPYYYVPESYQSFKVPDLKNTELYTVTTSNFRLIDF
jgi:hypothetical protein